MDTGLPAVFGLGQPAATGIPEPFHERARRHAVRRHAGGADVRDQRLGGSRSDRHRLGHFARDIGADLRSIFHDQVHRARHRARASRSVTESSRNTRERSKSARLRARAPPSGWSSPPQGKQCMPKGLHPGRRRRSGNSRGPGTPAGVGRLQRNDRAEPARPAWRDVDEQPFDLLLLDVSLPDRNGLELLARNPPTGRQPAGGHDHRVRLNRYGALGIQERRAGLHHQTVVQRRTAGAGGPGGRRPPPARRKRATETRSQRALQLPEHHRQERGHRFRCWIWWRRWRHRVRQC